MSDNGRLRRPQLVDYQRALESMGTIIDVAAQDVMTLAERAQHFSHQRLNEILGVTQIMSQPVRFVHPQTLMSEAAHLMVKERISGLPVVDDNDQLVGIITEADFLRGLGLPAHYPTHNIWQTLEAMFSHLGQQSQLEAPNDAVSAYMVRDVVSTSPDDNVHGVLELMKRHQIKRVLICDQDRHLLGVITRSDLVRVFFDRYKQSGEK
ncbi:CBS domain-containing protein [Magnetovibrio sp.]|uniref:CBS domain-containing protein n=1 Tax=Magnetovibrio sp. TaxID=2024836 RepID=UPI002F95E46E